MRQVLRQSAVHDLRQKRSVQAVSASEESVDRLCMSVAVMSTQWRDVFAVQCRQFQGEASPLLAKLGMLQSYGAAL